VSEQRNQAEQIHTVTATALSLHLVARAERCNLPPIRQCVEGLLFGWRRPCLDEEEVGEILLALLEACSNVIAHAYQGREPGDIEIDVKVDDTGITMTVRDQGVGFDLERVPPPKFGRKPALHGYGLYMMRGLMDLVHVSREGEHTVLHISRRWRSPLPRPGEPKR
jgi:anti-sigma regulatory factor (Ser/Thr protein kinase)